MNGYTYLQLLDMGVDVKNLHIYGKSTGDFLGYYKGHFRNLYWFSNA